MRIMRKQALSCVEELDLVLKNSGIQQAGRKLYQEKMSAFQDKAGSLVVNAHAVFNEN